MAQSKDPKDPFNGTLFRREPVVPQAREEVVPTYKQKAEELKASAMNSVDRDAMELEAARIRTETAKLELQHQELMARLNPPAAGAAPAPFTGTTKKLIDLLAVGEQLGIDVTPIIQRVLTGQSLAPAPAAPMGDLNGIPNPLMSAIGKMLEKSFDNNNKPPQESTELAVLKERMKNQEANINQQLESIKTLLTQRPGVDPNVAAVDNIKNIALLMNAVKALTPEPPPAAPATPGSSDLAFKYQDRQWLHEEKKLEAEIRKHEIEMNARVEASKLEQSKSNMAQIPEMIGAVVAQSLLESGKNKGTGASANVPQKAPVVVKLSKSKDKAHGVITIKCEDCHSDVSFMTSAKQANCINCGTVYHIQLTETEGGATSVERVDDAQTPPAQEKPIPTSTDGYLFQRGM